MKDIITSIKAHLYDRTSSPLMGAFIVSWIIWNYRFILTITSDLKLQDKFKYISDVLYSEHLDLYGKGILFPIITALVFIYFYPWPALMVFDYSKKMTNKLQKRKQELEGQRLLSIEDSIELIQKGVELKVKYESIMETTNLDFDQKISGFKLEIEKLGSSRDPSKTKLLEEQESLITENFELKKSLNKLTSYLSLNAFQDDVKIAINKLIGFKQLSAEYYKILNYFSHLSQPIGIQDIHDAKLDIEGDISKYIDILKNAYFLSVINNESGVSKYDHFELTPIGKSYVDTYTNWEASLIDDKK